MKRMNDMISRHAATQTALEFIVEYLGGAFDEDFQRKLIERMNTLPSAQPEIVRCKDCRHWREQGLCGIWDHYISNGKFYCGCAEREEGEADG